MMTRVISAAFALGLSAAGASAADLTFGSEQSWDGTYFGGQIGGVYADFDNNVPASPGPTGDGFNAIGGVHIGFNRQNGATIWGGELEFNLSLLEASSAGGSMSEDMVAMARLRYGQVVDGTYYYGTGGIAMTQRDTTIVGLGNDKDWVAGPALGFGAERWLGDEMTGRAEIIYFHVPDDPQNVGGLSVIGGSDNIVIRVGVSRHF